MKTEARVIVRLIALWIVLIVSLGMVFWAGQQFAVAMVKIASGNYGDTSCGMGYCPPAMTFTSCIMPPPYPATPMMGEGGAGVVDPGTMTKYNQDYQKYSESYQKACEQDVARQQGSQKNSSITDLAGYSVLLLLGVVVAVTSLMAIRKSEMEAWTLPTKKLAPIGVSFFV